MLELYGFQTWLGAWPTGGDRSVVFETRCGLNVLLLVVCLARVCVCLERISKVFGVIEKKNYKNKNNFAKIKNQLKCAHKTCYECQTRIKKVQKSI